MVLQSGSGFDQHLPTRIRVGLGLAAAGLAASGRGRRHGRIDNRTERCGLILECAGEIRTPDVRITHSNRTSGRKSPALHPPPSISNVKLAPEFARQGRVNSPDPPRGGRRRRGGCRTRATRDSARGQGDDRRAKKAGAARSGRAAEAPRESSSAAETGASRSLRQSCVVQRPVDRRWLAGSMRCCWIIVRWRLRFDASPTLILTSSSRSRWSPGSRCTQAGSA